MNSDRTFTPPIFEGSIPAIMTLLSTFGEGPDLVLYYKELMVLEGNAAYRYQIYNDDQLSASQKKFLHTQWKWAVSMNRSTAVTFKEATMGAF